MSKIHCVGAYQVRASVPPLAETQGFNGYPPLGVNATLILHDLNYTQHLTKCFNGHPPLGVNATFWIGESDYGVSDTFQWAPTLGGECYGMLADDLGYRQIFAFQWAPTLGGECY